MQDAAERLSLEPNIGEIERASVWAREVAERLAVPARSAFALDLCLEEALSNTIRYGFASGSVEAAKVELSLTREPEALRVTIEDNAAPFDPCAAEDTALPTDLETARVGGLGIHLMRNFTTAIAYERVDGRNRLTLWFGIGPA